jgi:YD repeat-containing protein
MTDGTGTSSYTWDPYGELASQADGASQTTSYRCDTVGDVTSITYPLPASATWASSDTVTLSYHDPGNVSAVTDFNGNQLAITDTRDNLPAAVTLGSTGDTISTTYDATGSPSLISLANGSGTLQPEIPSRRPTLPASRESAGA